jgi:putative methionine-R-sulfoxide reductase with GAF domain
VLPGLVDQLALASTVVEAAQQVVGFAVHAGLPLPSLYLERGGTLRCIAQHGYWQVFDGIGPGTGVAGTTYASGERSVVLDVAKSSNYIAAYPAVVAEICEPIQVDGRTVGVLNIESPVRLTTADAAFVTQLAMAFAQRLTALGGPPLEAPAERLARFGSDLCSRPCPRQRWDGWPTSSACPDRVTPRQRSSASAPPVCVTCSQPESGPSQSWRSSSGQADMVSW